ncbi:hypothetical protein FrCorBMG51_08540 [Protofrankia coriariae]|uniref:Uncharacterized protein n=1 Tax=Protofrankia coriariae TaxID=1562887 RepID=A0ABR5F594_9ACTN|nr:hypothetical protein FrCorBMG51_08540 [Protofrankia coriariae]
MRLTVRQRLAHQARRVALTAATRVLDLVAPAEVAPALPAAVPAAVEPKPTIPALFAPGELPDVEVIDAAAVAFDRAADLARIADRGKRKARRLLDRLPDGVYGRVTVERVPSAKTTPDMEQIRADYARAGLGDVPMKPVAPTLKVTVAPAAPVELVAA